MGTSPAAAVGQGQDQGNEKVPTHGVILWKPLSTSAMCTLIGLGGDVGRRSASSVDGFVDFRDTGQAFVEAVLHVLEHLI